MRIKCSTRSSLCEEIWSRTMVIPRTWIRKEMVLSASEDSQQREWDRIAEQMMLTFAESQPPVFRSTSPLSRGVLRSKGGGKLSIHYFAAENPFWINSPGPKTRIRIMWIIENTVRFWTFEEKRRNNSSDGEFFRNNVGLIHLAGLRVLKHFSKKKSAFSPRFISLFIFSFIFSLLFHLLSSFSLSSSLSSLFSLLSSLVLSFLFHLLFAFLYCLVFSCLVLFCLLLSSPLLSLLCRLLFSVPVFFLCLCLSLSPCGVVVVLLCCVLSCVVVCVVWHRENPVCPLKTCPCVRSKRARVYRHHAHMLNTCARGASTQVYVSNVHMKAFLNPHTGGRCKFCLQRKAHVEFSLGPREVHQSNHWIFQFSSLRTDREQHVPDSSNHSLYLMKLFVFRETSCYIVRFVFASISRHNERCERQYRHEPPPAFALLKPRSPSFKSLLKPLSRSRNVDIHINMYIYIYIYVLIY